MLYDELVKKMAWATGMKHYEIVAVMEWFRIIITAELAAGGTVSLPGIGKFYSKLRSPRLVKTRLHGEALRSYQVPSRWGVRFRAYQKIREAVNAKAVPPAAPGAAKSDVP